MAGEGVTAMIVAADAGDNPLADRREDPEAAAERERKAKVANAMAAVRAQLDLRGEGGSRQGREQGQRRRERGRR